MAIKIDIVNEAAKIIEAGFARQKGLALSVVGEDPIVGALGWKNGTITSGTTIFLGFILGTYNASDSSFSAAAFTMDGVQYAYGALTSKAAVAPGASEIVNVYSYALAVAAAMNFDALVFVCLPGTLTQMQVNYGGGVRTVGIKWSEFLALPLSAYKIFTGVLTINPKPDPATILTFSMGKG